MTPHLIAPAGAVGRTSPPDHTRIRRHVSLPLGRKRVAALRPHAEQLAGRMLSRVGRARLPRRTGERMSVLWSRENPSLGGITGTASELHRLADAQWEMNPAGGNVWAGVALVFGLCMLPWVFLFALGLEGETLQELAWSPGVQSVHALIILCAAYGYTPALTGHSAHGLQALFQAGDWLLIAGMLFSPAYQLIKENRS
ncbi:hypothetical protein [Streptomyces syringium]|uniref:hypothetical protein n=1 Tax=Streptomyces syringium TaxID=76729 RepID=UPI0037D16358